MAKQRISLAKELRIKQLADQGYNAETIAAICNVRNSGTVSFVIRRARRHWLYPNDPLKGRVRNFLSDNDIEDIRARRAQGEACQSIADDYHIGLDSVSKIALGITYRNDEIGFPFDFAPKLARRLL